MKNISFITVVLLVLITACTPPVSKQTSSNGFISSSTMQTAITRLTDSIGADQKPMIEKGITQVAKLWQQSDGSQDEFIRFCEQNYLGDSTAKKQLFNKLQTAFETIFGAYNKMGLDLRIPVDLDLGEVTTIDETFASFAPSAHLTDDLFANKVAFITILNFPAYSLDEKTANAEKWSRQEWAYARMGDLFTSRVPAELNQKITDALAKSDMYISEYNIMMGKLVNEKGESLFPADLKLISHWGLRDELKSHYGQADGLQKQKMIYSVMKHIIDQSIPEVVINNDKFIWNPLDNKVTENGKSIDFSSEPDTRYQMLLDNFKAMKAVDPYFTTYPSYPQRAFELSMEIPQKDVEKLFITLLQSPEVKDVAALISKRLGRNLEPFDIWYDGFKARSTMNEDNLTAITSKRYPNPAAFEADMANMLKKLGWSAERASFIASKIQVDPARGSGHAAGAQMRGDKARLRTRIPASGMNYKGYNIAVHEFGHNVEQTIDLYNIDFYMMQGVPNTAFTEALAFTFQNRDLELLGMKDNNTDKEALAALDAFWMSYEIMGVSLVDMAVWDWLYKNPDATAAQLKEAVISNAKDVWNKYYAPVFGSKDEPILAIYSHMIDNPLYLPNYPVGHLIDFQISTFLKGKNFANEVDRMYTAGRLTPQQWMKNAVGAELSVDPLLKSTRDALKVIK